MSGCWISSPWGRTSSISSYGKPSSRLSSARAVAACSSPDSIAVNAISVSISVAPAVSQCSASPSPWTATMSVCSPRARTTQWVCPSRVAMRCASPCPVAGVVVVAAAARQVAPNRHLRHIDKVVRLASVRMIDPIRRRMSASLSLSRPRRSGVSSCSPSLRCR